MHSKKSNIFETTTLQIESEFSQFSRIHADWEFVLTDKKSRQVKNTKKFRMLAIHNDAQRYQHIGVIISELSNEYVQLPDLVQKFLSEIQKTVEANTDGAIGDKKLIDMSGFKFTGNVYLYTDRLLVSEDAVQKHFKKSNLNVHFRVEKKNFALR